MGLFLLVWGLLLNLYCLSLYLSAWKIIYTKENRADYSAPWLDLKKLDAPYSQISFDPFAHTITEYEKLAEEYGKLVEKYERERVEALKVERIMREECSSEEDVQEDYSTDADSEDQEDFSSDIDSE